MHPPPLQRERVLTGTFVKPIEIAQIPHQLHH